MKHILATCPWKRQAIRVFIESGCAGKSAAIRQNYNEIADMCRKTSVPVSLTKNGEGDRVVMDIDACSRREAMLKLREELFVVEENRMYGSRGYSLDTMPQRCPWLTGEYIPENICRF